MKVIYGLHGFPSLFFVCVCVAGGGGGGGYSVKVITDH